MSQLATYSGLVNKSESMKTDILTAFSIFSSPEQDSRIKSLFSKYKEILFFECEGEFFKGDRKLAFIKFILDEPTGGDFYVWCQDNLQRFTKAK